MYSQHPDIAKRWERVTPKGKKLPKHVKRKKKRGAKKLGRRMRKHAQRRKSRRSRR